MKTAILQVEPYDDVASIRDKVLWCRSERILLVLPKQKRAFPGLLELNLIERWAKENGASLAVVSRSDITREYAQSLKIPFFSSIPEAQRGEWSINLLAPDPHSGIRGKESILEMREDLPMAGKKPLHSRLRLAIAVVTAIALFSLLLFLLPSATVIVYPEPEMQALALDIRASKEFSQVNITGLLPAYEETLTVSGQQTLTSTGTVMIGKESAIGDVTFRNLTKEELTIPKGSVVAIGGAESIRYATTRDVILPVGDGGVTAQVEALEPGVEGNVEAGQITMLEGSHGSKVEVSNSTPFAGGSSSNANAPTENDYQRARTTLLQELEILALENTKTNANNKKIPIKESLSISEVLIEKQLNPIGAPSDTLTLEMTTAYNLLVYDPAQLQTLVEDILDLSIPEGYHDAEGIAAVRNQANIEISNKGEASWRVEASRRILKNLPVDMLLTKIRGIKKADAIRMLNEKISHMKSAEVITFVNWWPWLPLLTGRINMVERLINGG